MTDEAPAQGTPPQDQQAPPAPAPPAAPAAPVAAPPAPGPWANDLASTFADEAERARVDAFLRSKVQPYTTQLEQQAASLKDAERLYSDLSNSPIDTYVAITNEMFGEQAAQDMLALLQNEQAQQTAPAAEGQQPQQVASDPRLQSVISYVEQRQQQEYYDGELARIQQAHPEVVPAHLAPFVAAAQGDFDQAYETYTTWLRDVTQTNTEPPPAAEAPAVLTGDGSAPTPPVAPKKQSLDEAIADFMAEQRPNAAPPVVGGV